MSRRLEVPAPAGFNFRAVVLSHGWYHLSPFRWDDAAATLHRVEDLGTAGVLDLSITFDGAVVVEGDRDLSRVAKILVPRIRRMLQLDIDLSEFHKRCARKASHRAAAAAGFGRLLCGTTVFEDIVKIITTTNTTWSQTVRMNSLLTATLGRESKNGQRAFPTPAAIAAKSEKWLADNCRLGYRARYIRELSRAVAKGITSLESLGGRHLTTPELIAAYRTLPGIGPYGAAHLAAMEGRHDFIAVDTEFRRFVRDRYFGGEKSGDAELLEVYANWGRWRYLAYWSELWEESARAKGIF